MRQWTSYEEIKKHLLKKWEQGLLLKSDFLADDLFPMTIALKHPTAKEFEYLPEIIHWMEQLQAQALIDLQFRQITSKIHGTQTLPTHAVVRDLDSAVKILKKQTELKNFRKRTADLHAEFPALDAWVLQKPLRVLQIEDLPSYLKVLKWFIYTHKTPIYLREICIEGLHTKFIEQNKATLSHMLDVLLPPHRVDTSKSKFEDRYLLKSAPVTVRFRILDDAYSIHGMTDLEIPVREFETLNLPVDRVFFVENLTNFLSFPPKKSACVLFSKGYFVEALQQAQWLGQKQLYYWGDIDTHGFNILSMARKWFPSIQSILMTEEILLAHQAM